MTKIGILNCSNAAREFGCCSCLCFKELAAQSGKFSVYEDGAILLGMVSCAGCPTAIAPEKIMKSVKPLAMLGIEKLHLSSCMTSFCPFISKYEKVIKEHFPNLEIVYGTHDASPEQAEEFHNCFKEILTSTNSIVEMMAQKKQS